MFTGIPIGNPDIIAVGGKFVPETGEISLEWNGMPDDVSLVVSYEYNIAENNASLLLNNGFDLSKITFKNFLTNEELHECHSKAETVAGWDFNTALGQSIKEKYHSLYVKVVELTNVLIRKGAKGYFWIVCSPEVSSIFETTCWGFSTKLNESDCAKQEPMGMVGHMQYKGIVNQRWRLFAHTDFEHQILIGVNDKVEEPRHYGRLSIFNFII